MKWLNGVRNWFVRKVFGLILAFVWWLFASKDDIDSMSEVVPLDLVRSGSFWQGAIVCPADNSVPSGRYRVVWTGPDGGIQLTPKNGASVRDVGDNEFVLTTAPGGLLVVKGHMDVRNIAVVKINDWEVTDE